MPPIRLAIVGFGKIARDQHRPAITASPDFELVAVASRHGRIERLPHRETLQDLLASGIAFDAVALCTPPTGRGALAATALAAGKHVLMEKPPGATLSELAPLSGIARQAGVSLFATWHSRFAPAVEPMRALLAKRRLLGVEIVWKEDVRHWHPGQDWIFEPGGLGVFDPGINALSILTTIWPRAIVLDTAELSFPMNRAAPIAANMTMADTEGVPIRAAFDFRQTGAQSWDIHVETDAGRVALSSGGARLVDGERLVLDEREAEYPAIYARFRSLIEAGASDLDLAPLTLVADAFMLGRRRTVETFEW